ncbi:MAG: penicillin-binding protein 2 [Syntrophobacterales bacterium]|jgi:penicillin-binding protein 2|nr:penicillin-binding protein 2 [Syntrophobacterales bacterium]
MSRLHEGRFSGFKVMDTGFGGAMPPEEQECIRRTYARTALIILCLFGILFLRLWFLQLLQGGEMQERSEHNRIRLQDLPPWRGMILDRKGEVLVANRPSYELVVVLEDVADIPSLAGRLGQLLHLDPQQITTQLQNGKKAGLHQVRLRTDLSWEEMARVETFQPELPGVLVQIQPKREYRQKGRACHALGYLGEISDVQMKNSKYADYKMGDYIGKCGVELAWEKYLRGQRGYRRIEVDAYGRELGQMDSVFPTPGANVSLTLDNRMQQEAEACLEDKVGAIVALDPNTGNILVLASSPTFSQEAFERGLTVQEWDRLHHDKTHPLENRALKGQYPPGSTFKIVMAVAGLEENVITPGTTFYCNGALPLGNHVFHCWLKGGHGSVNLYKALVESCDVYFYELGQRLGIDRIAKWSKRFGLGEPTGLNLDREAIGLVASSAWKKARFHKPWHEGETLSVAIGQGYNLATPIQMARVVAAIANGGIIYKTHLVEKVESPAGEILYQAKPEVQSRLDASPATLEAVRRALVGVVSEKKGTGKAARLASIEVAGKTGTAQVVSLDPDRTKRKKDPSREDHAWFVAYAPADNPRIAVAVLIEHGGHGGSAAGPLASRVIKAGLSEPRVAQAK